MSGTSHSRTSSKRALSQMDYETLAEFRYALRKFLHFSEQAAGLAGLTAQQHQALLAIRGFPGREQITIGELAEKLQIRHHSAGGLVDRLIRENLVRREAAVDDLRKVFVSLTESGTRVLEELSTSHREELQVLGPDLLAALQRLVSQ
ncbi:MAG: MarR family winged helix-turn-helix transcriptional regulator [Chthoniobacteraceae bacterium]